MQWTAVISSYSLHCVPLYLEKVLDAFWIVAATFTTDAFHFLHLSRLARRLDVLEVHLGILTEVHD